MHLLYLDESGQHDSNYFALGGAAIFERQTYWLGQELDRLQAEFLPAEAAPVELHASAIRAGRMAPWRELDQQTRYRLLDEVYERIAESRAVLFGVAVNRAWLQAWSGEDEYGFAFESVMKRFDSYLARLYKETGEPERGLVVVAESQFRQRIETLALKVRREGTRWGELFNLAEVPLFTLASNSRLLQVADFCANAIHGRYEAGFTRSFDRLAGKFAADNGVIHGLAHFTFDSESCYCPACLSRRPGVARTAVAVAVPTTSVGGANVVLESAGDSPSARLKVLLAIVAQRQLIDSPPRFVGLNLLGTELNAQSRLGELIDSGHLIAYQVRNPKRPEWPTSAVRVNIAHSEVKLVLEEELLSQLESLRYD